MARQWRQLSLKDARRHPLYGIKNWLAVFAFGILVSPLRSIGELSKSAREVGLTLSHVLTSNAQFGVFIKASLAFDLAIAALLLWLLFSKHRHFRVATIALLILQWPGYLVVAYITGGTQIPGLVGAFVQQFLGSLLLNAIWVTYVQRSRRVRVTFENCVVVEKAEASDTQRKTMRSAATPTATAGNDAYAAALAEIEECRLDKGTWARSFAESGGDEPKAKALYIKARAAAIGTEAVWVNTVPPTTDSARAETVKTSRTFQSDDSLPKWVPAFIAFALIAGVVGYQQYNNRHAVAANPIQARVPMVDGSQAPTKDQFGGTLVTGPAKRNQIDEFLDGAPKTTQTAAWSSNPFDKFDTVDEIAARARQFSQLNEARAWAAVLAWQESNMRVDKIPANEALHNAVGTVLDGLRDNKGVCRPGQVEIVSAAQASKSFPAGTLLTLLECDR